MALDGGSGRCMFTAMSFEEKRDSDLPKMELSLVGRLKRLVSTGADLTPALGTTKLFYEAVRGLTLDNFPLNRMERGAYFATVAFRATSYLGIYELVFKGDYLEGGAFISICGVGSWTFLALGKARQTGEVFSIQSLWTGVQTQVSVQEARVDELSRQIYFLIERLIREDGAQKMVDKKN